MKQISAPVNPKKRVNKSRFPHHLFIESYGVGIRVSSNNIDAIDVVRGMLPKLLAGHYNLTSHIETNHKFYYAWNKSGRDSLYKDGETIAIRQLRESVLAQMDSYIRLTVAEFAVNKVFIHAGVVSWKGKAIIMPGKSFQGKSTLTAALVRRGAQYYSDEYAILDKNGLVSPFPKMISIRGEIDDYQQIDYPVEAFGGTAGIESVPVGMILSTEYKPNGKWKPRILTRGKGAIELIKNALSIRYDPTFNLLVINRVTKNSVVVKSPRGEATDVADMILEFFENTCL